MPQPALARVELDRFWVNPGDRIFAMYTFASYSPSDRPLTVAVRLRQLDGEAEHDCGFAPSLPTAEWPEGAFVREGLAAICIPEDAEPGKYALLVGLVDPESGQLLELSNSDEGAYCRACKVDVMPPRWVGRREPITHDLLSHPAEPRPEPLERVVLRSDGFEVVLDAGDGLPYRFRTPSGAEIAGEPWGAKIVAAVNRLEPRASIARELHPVRAELGQTRAVFLFGVDCLGAPAAEFELAYALDGSTVLVTLENVVEFEGYELVQVELPGLASVSTNEPEAWIAYAEDGGQLAKLADTRGGRLRATTEWRFSAPVAMVGGGDALAALEVPSYLDTTELTVDPDGPKTAWLGTTRVVRVPGGKETQSLPAGQQSVCRLHVLGGRPTWLDAVKQIRPLMPAVPTRYYDSRNVYKIFCQCGGSPPVTSFEEAGKIINEFAALTENWPQSVYLVGWQYTGHDTGYPAVDVVNGQIGGESGLKELMDSAARANCTVSFHDNYDDAYRDSPDWEERYITRNPDGSLMMGGYWAGGQTWIIGMANYSGTALRYAAATQGLRCSCVTGHGSPGTSEEGRGWERAVHTCRKYGIRDTYHIDVLSAEALRHDWNPECPASAFANLMGKCRIVDAFASQGADVTTEGVSWPFIGKVTWFNTLQQAVCDRFGGEASVPMVQSLLRHSARWGGNAANADALLRSLFRGCSFGTEVSAGPTAVTQLADTFYLLQVPWLLLRDRPLETYEARDGVCVLGYGPATSVTLNWNTSSYSVMIDGTEVARDMATFVPLGEDRLAFYSVEARELSAPVPAGWEPARMAARVLSANGEPQEFAFECRDGQVRVGVPARQPVIVCR